MEESKRKGLSSFRDPRSASSRSIAFAFRPTDSLISLNASLRTVQREWVCTACSYHNADFGNRICSVCGLDRDEPNIPAASEVCSLLSATEKSASLHDKVVEHTEQKGGLRGSNGQYEKTSQMIELSLDDTPHAPPESLTDETQRFLGSINSRPSKGAPREQDSSKEPCSRSAPPVPEGGETWSCILCTFVNANPLHLVCQVCGHQRDKDSHLATTKNKNNNEGSSSRSSILIEQECFLQKQRRMSEEDELKALQTQRLQELIAIQAKLFQELEDENRDSDEDEEDNNQSSNGRSPNTQVPRCA